MKSLLVVHAPISLAALLVTSLASLAQTTPAATLSAGGTVEPSGLILVLGQPLVAATSQGTLGIVPLLTGGETPSCPADFNSINGVTVQDIFDYLASYFAGCTAPGVPSPSCSRSADFNGQSGVTVQDIFDFLGTYFAGC